MERKPERGEAKKGEKKKEKKKEKRKKEKEKRLMERLTGSSQKFCPAPARLYHTLIKTSEHLLVTCRRLTQSCAPRASFKPYVRPE